MHKRIILFFFVLLVCSSAFAEDIVVSDYTISPLPDAITTEEKPIWLSDLRRFEIISFGVLPIALFYTRMATDLYRFTKNNFETTYLPWPFKSESSYTLTDEEQYWNLGIAAVLSITFATIDAIIVGKNKSNNEGKN